MPFAPEFYWVFTAFVFLAGCCVGSFLNVCIWRIPREESIVFPASHCPSCNHPIAPWDNLPLVSWLVLRGRCRHCRAGIPPRYFVVELLTGALLVALWGVHGWSWLTLIYLVFASALIMASAVDLDHLILPDRVTIGGMVLGPLLALAHPPLLEQTGRLAALWQSLIGMALGFGLLWSVATVGRLVLKREAMGFGDVKLLGAIGACLGWQAVLFTVLVSSLSGSVLGLGLIAAGKKELQSRIPYGPHIALAAVVWMLCGPAIIEAYLNWTSGAVLVFNSAGLP